MPKALIRQKANKIAKSGNKPVLTDKQMSNKRNGNNNSSIDYQQNHDPRVPYFVTLSKLPLSKLLSRTITNTI